MKPKNNPYASLLQPGIRGKANPEDQVRETIYNTTSMSIEIVTAQLLPGVWDYGYTIRYQEKEPLSKLPGEGQGWFRTQKDAILFCLGFLRTLFDIDSSQLAAIDTVISRNTIQTLF